jgi:hypothetical protein
MRHLFATRAEVLRLSGETEDGTPTMSWVKVPSIVDLQLGRPGELLCRLDLSFQRPGKDQPMPVVAGRAPDRVGVMFYSTGCDVLAGDRIRAVTGPITGTFEIRIIPDPAQGFSICHHMEVQIVEVATNTQDTFPGGSLDAYRVEPA